MNGRELFDAIGQLDSRFVEEAARYQGGKRSGWVRWCLLAACLALVLFAGIRSLLPTGQNSPSQDPGQDQPSVLPQLTLPSGFGGGMSFEGYLATDISDLVDANPWTPAADLTALPVFANLVSFDENSQPIGRDRKEMEDTLYSLFRQFGVEREAVKLQEGDMGSDVLYDLTGTGGGLQVQVLYNRRAILSLPPEEAVPEAYRVSESSSCREVLETANYLKEQYAGRLGMVEPVAEVRGGAYDFDLHPSYQIALYEGAGTLVDQIVRYNVGSVLFSMDSDGLLTISFNTELPEKVGDYPILSPEEAEGELLRGCYLTDVPYEIQDESFVKKVELIYRSWEFGEHIMPFYRFYVELPEEAHDGLNTYGAYYVPAVDSAYLTNPLSN